MDDRIFKFLKDMKRDTNGEFPELPDDKAQELGDDLIEEYIESLFEKYTYHDEDGNKQVMNATCKDESQTFCNSQNLKSVNAYHHAIANRWAAFKTWVSHLLSMDRGIEYGFPIALCLAI